MIGIASAGSQGKLQFSDEGKKVNKNAPPAMTRKRKVK